MLPLVAPEDFKGTLRIAYEEEAVRPRLCKLIAAMQPELLREYFGSTFAIWLAAQLATNPIPAPVSELVNGVQWTGTDGQSYFFIGLKEILKRDIYYRWKEETDSYSSTMGESKPNKENASTISPRDRMVRTWNEKIDLMESMYYMLTYRESNGIKVYPDYCAQRTRRINAFDL